MKSENWNFRIVNILTSGREFACCGAGGAGGATGKWSPLAWNPFLPAT